MQQNHSTLLLQSTHQMWHCMEKFLKWSTSSYTQHSSSTLPRTWIMAISTNLTYLGMCQNSICIKYPPNSRHKIENKSNSMETLELLFMHNLDIPCSKSRWWWSSSFGTTLLDSPNPTIFGLQYHIFKMSECSAKCPSLLGCN